ncbi:MAG: lipid A export permease/ATP-binding protein MsbA [Elusimicrobiota bacterium]
MNTLKRMLSYIKPYKSRFFGALVSMIGIALLTAFLMWLIKPVMNNIFAEKKLNIILPLGAVIIGASLVKGILVYIQSYLMFFIGQSIIKDIRNQVYNHLTRLSMSFYSVQSTGKIMSRLTNDMTLIQNALTNVPANVIRDGCTLIALTALAFFLNWKLALIAFFVFPIATYPVTKFGRKLRNVSKEGQKQMGFLYTILHESIVGIKVIKAFNLEQERNEFFEKENKSFFAITMRSMRVMSMTSPIMEFIGSFAISAIIVIGGYQVVKGPMTQGDFFAFIGAVVSLYNPVKSLSNLNNVIQQGIAASERVFSILDTKPIIVESENAVNMETLSESISFQNVSFGYASHTRVLYDVNLHIKKGEMIALVGPSGSGKTTIINLIPRFYDAEEGQIIIDKINIKDLKIASLRRQIGIVTQDVMLFDDSVKNNILLGNRASSFEEVINAAKTAHAHEFIQAMHDGYDTHVGEHGVRLSGGQRQRIAIARAILKNPSILILDEATSSLDAESERLVQDALDHLVQDRTTLVVAHRLSTIRKADRVLVIDGGRIVEQGSHDELLSLQGLYAKLYKLQFHEGIII